MCQQCEYKTNQSYNWKGHVMGMHEKIKNFTCEICGYAAIRSDHLKNYVMAVHQKLKIFTCEQCEYRASEDGALFWLI